MKEVEEKAAEQNDRTGLVSPVRVASVAQAYRSLPPSLIYCTEPCGRGSVAVPIAASAAQCGPGRSSSSTFIFWSDDTRLLFIRASFLPLFSLFFFSLVRFFFFFLNFFFFCHYSSATLPLSFTLIFTHRRHLFTQLLDVFFSFILSSV